MINLMFVFSELVGDENEAIGESKHKKARTSFSTEQIQMLERRFVSHWYLSANERARLAGELKLSDQQVSTGEK